MCGICGFNWSEKEIISRINDTIKHRGPDGEGIYVDENVSLGHRRLAILDLSEKGKQPMSDKEGSIVITYNGEIYNFLELKEELKKKGYVFESNTDTEVIIYAYKEYGFDCVKKFNGMWAFCIYDSSKNIFFLSRDRMGKKPLYYYLNNGLFIFCSEIKGILEFEEVKRKLNKNVLVDYLINSFTSGSETLISKINKLPSAYSMIFDLNTKETKIFKYWDIEKDNIVYNDFDSSAKKLHEILEDSVKKRLISDVPVGSFLSGGLDSSLVTALYSKFYDKEMYTFSVGFDEEVENELNYANAVSEHLGTNHHEFFVTGDKVLKEFDKITWYYDEPLGDAAIIANYFISKYAKKYVSVVLAGEGGDEVFAGYMEYKYWSDFMKISSKFPSFIKKPSQLISKYIPNRKIKKGLELMGNSDNYSSYFMVLRSAYKKNELKKFLNFKSDYDNSKTINDTIKPFRFLNQLLYTDQRILLPERFNMKADKSTMASGLEERCPLQDYRVVEFSYHIDPEFKLYNKTEKYILKFVGKEYLPEITTKRKKQGYGVPLEYWMKNDLKDFLIQTFDESLLIKKVFNDNIKKYADINNIRFEGQRWGLFALERWMKVYEIEV